MKNTTINAIDWSVINSIPLNDFFCYNILLFTPEELQQENCWEKYIKYSCNKVPIGVYMPFANPQTVHEFALNHYVYWMVLYYTKVSDKIEYFYDYNTKESMKAPELFCWACAYHYFIVRKRMESENIMYGCKYCPIWVGKQDFQCEKNGELYKRWNKDNLEKARDIAELEWHDFDYLIKKSVMDEKQLKKEYNNFILQWMLSHGHNIEELIKLLTDYQTDFEDDFDDGEKIQTIFDEWVLNQGFGGEIWPCFEEWAESEYLM